jgi:iron(III) transport system ATP-binding protein
MVFQEYALFPHLTVADNISFGLSGSRADKQARVRELLALVNLPDTGARMPYELSGGQQQRIALARALAARPAVVLLDEPFSNLDAALRKEMREEVRRILRESGTTAVFVTHDQQEALSLSDRVAMLHEGQLLQLDAPHDLYDNPVNEIIAAFVGESNFVEADARGQCAVGALGKVTLREAYNGPVRLLIRPELIRLALDDDEGVAAQIAWREYYGHDQRVGLMLDDGTPVVARFGTRYRLTPGDTIRVFVEGAVKAFIR